MGVWELKYIFHVQKLIKIGVKIFFENFVENLWRFGTPIF